MPDSRECDLCGLGCVRYPLREVVAGADRFFCCTGCMNVYLILWESGTIQAGQDIRQTELFQRSLRLGLISNRESGSPESKSPVANPENSEELLLHVSGMWCTSCAWLIEHALASLPGIVRAEVSFASDLLRVQYCPQLLPPARITERISNLGYKSQKFDQESDATTSERRDLIIRTGLAAFLWANVMSFSLVLYAGYFEQISGSIRSGLPFVLMALATPVVFYCAQPVLRLAWRGLLNGAIRMEALLAIGILTAYGYSVVQSFRGEIHLYFDTATIIVALVLAGKLIEHGAKEKASLWMAQLHRMMPTKVRLLHAGTERFVTVDALAPRQIFVVKAGERIPADGVVLEGESHADESLITGESTPVAKRVGHSVAAGSINLDGLLQVEATKTASESTLANIIGLVEKALSGRSDLERTVDRVSRIFVPSVVVVAVLTFAVAWSTGVGFTSAVMRAVTVLVIACPCALGLATPLAIVAAIGVASRRGILVRDVRVLEMLRKVDTVLLDKTGTVTEGKFSLLELIKLKEKPAEAIVAGRAQVGSATRELWAQSSSANESSEMLDLLAGLEQYSEHPLGVAITEFARRKRVNIPEGKSIEIQKGRGIRGVVRGKHVFAGNRRLTSESEIWIDERSDELARHREEQGKTVAFVGWDGDVQALAIFGDGIKPEMEELVTRLRQGGVDVRLVSGDARLTTGFVASSLGIESYESELVPEEKVEIVKRLQSDGRIVAMVGDGINDAPALAQADLGIAMGSGADIAMKAASVVLMGGEPRKILEVFEIAQRSMRVVRQNLFWAFFYNILGISLAVTGVLNPIFAAVAMLLSSVAIVGNTMRLARMSQASSLRADVVSVLRN